MFFNEVVGKKNKHKNRKAIWFEYINVLLTFIIRITNLCPREIFKIQIPAFAGMTEY
jgi:hypothetical protein